MNGARQSCFVGGAMRDYITPLNDIHDFRHDLAWSPDSRHVAITDCLYDWTATADPNTNAGDESNRRCVVAIAALNGGPQIVPLAGTTEVALKWLDAHRLAVGGKIVTVP